MLFHVVLLLDWGSHMADLLIFSGLDLVCLHTAFGSSAAIMGFSFSIRRPP